MQQYMRELEQVIIIQSLNEMHSYHWIIQDEFEILSALIHRAYLLLGNFSCYFVETF